MSYFWKPYVTVAERKKKALKEMEALRKKGVDIQPVVIDGRTIARSFWGKAWCQHLESFSDFANRLPRGRTYARNGSVCHLAIKAGVIEAKVFGSELYNINIRVKPLQPATWDHVKSQCFGRIGSMLELLQGRLSDEVMQHVCDRKRGLFPLPGEMTLDCSCPDWATMCKHVAAALYGAGNRLDTQPELLFLLRGVEASELIAGQIAVPDTGAGSADELPEEGLAAMFGVEMDLEPAKPKAVKTEAPPAKKTPKPAKPKAVKTEAPPAKKTPKPAKTRAPKGPRQFDPDNPRGRDIATLRSRTHLSQSEFAAATGLSVASIKRFEATKGKLKLQSRTADAIARFQREFMEREGRS